MNSYANGVGSPLRDEDLHSCVDRQLAADRRAAIERHLRGHGQSAHRVAVYMAQRSALCAALADPANDAVQARLDPHLPLRQRSSERRNVWRVAAAVLLVIGIGVSIDAVPDGWVGQNRAEVAFGRQAASAYLTLAQTNPQSLKIASFAGLSESASKALGVAVKLHDTALSGYSLIGGWVLPAANGQAVQLAFRDVKDNKVITLYLEGRPGAKETPFRRVADASVPTVTWEDDELACAVSGTVEPDRLEPIGRQIYDALLS